MAKNPGSIPEFLAIIDGTMPTLLADVLAAFRDKGKGTAIVADLLAAQARDTVNSTSIQSKLTKSQTHQLRVAHWEADFVRRVEASKRAEPLRPRCSSQPVPAERL